MHSSIQYHMLMYHSHITRHAFCREGVINFRGYFIWSISC